jgi:hypothetical protein
MAHTPSGGLVIYIFSVVCGQNYDIKCTANAIKASQPNREAALKKKKKKIGNVSIFTTPVGPIWASHKDFFCI